MTNYPYAIEMSPEEYAIVKKKYKEDSLEGVELRYNKKEKIMATMIKDSKHLILTELDFTGIEKTNTRKNIEFILNTARLVINEARLRKEGWEE